MKRSLSLFTHILLYLQILAHAKPTDYAVLIDAGSSGTRAHVFSYSIPAGSPWVIVNLPSTQLRLKPGLSSYATDPTAAGGSLTPLLEFARKQVPSGRHKQTPIMLMATAGLRLLPADQTAALLDAVRKQLSRSGFLFRQAWAKVLPGTLEGLYAWTAFNYAVGKLHVLAARRSHVLRQKTFLPRNVQANSSLGILELGGASMQITFMPTDALPTDHSHDLPIPGVDQPLFTESFLGYGLDAAWFRAAMLVQERGNQTDPCLQRGYSTESGITGSGNFDECMAVASALLPREPCAFVQCSISGHYLPALSGQFLGVENFFFMSRIMGTARKDATLQELRAAGRRVCAYNWAELRRRYPETPVEYLVKACFSAAYSITVLSSIFHLGPYERRVTFSNAVKVPGGREVEVNWVLGALLVEVVGAHKKVPGDASPSASNSPSPSKTGGRWGAAAASTSTPAAVPNTSPAEAAPGVHTAKEQNTPGRRPDHPKHVPAVAAAVAPAKWTDGWVWTLEFDWRQRVVLALAGTLFIVVGVLVLWMEMRGCDAGPDGQAAAGSSSEQRRSCFFRGDPRRRVLDEAQPLTMLRSSPSRGLIARNGAGSDSGTVAAP